jgi:hypothetical protein
MSDTTAMIAFHTLSAVLGHMVKATALCALRGSADQIGVAYFATLPACDDGAVIDMVILLVAECADKLDRAVSVQVTEGEAAEASNPLAIVDRVTGITAVSTIGNRTIIDCVSGSPAALTDQLRGALPSWVTDSLAALANHSRTLIDVMTLLRAERASDPTRVVLLLFGCPCLPATEDDHLSGHCSG